MLGDSFGKYFDVVSADTPELLDQVYALRYHVYCVENKFEDPDQHPDGREMDSYDTRANHIALIYRPARQMVGTVRLILTAGSETAALPIDEVLTSAYRSELACHNRLQLAEISRYAVSRSFRRRRGEREFADIGWSEDSRRLLPHITLGLMGGVLELTNIYNIKLLCACMRPALLRLLAQFGLTFTPVGPLVEYHGLRQPCIADRESLLRGLRAHRPDFYDVVRSSMTPGPTT
jgi:N-acyl amino acid synthase of PEP-CTERM/exosortase system